MAATDRKTRKAGRSSGGKGMPTERLARRNSKTGQLSVPGSVVRTVSTREAKNQLSAIIRDARKEGEIIITSDDEPSAVVMSVDRYNRLAQQQVSLVEFFRRSPLVRGELRLERSRDMGRDVDLS